LEKIFARKALAPNKLHFRRLQSHKQMLDCTVNW
jgi:hypothetical protein